MYLILLRTGIILLFYRLFFYARFLAYNPQVKAIVTLTSGIELKVMCWNYLHLVS